MINPIAISTNPEYIHVCIGLFLSLFTFTSNKAFRQYEEVEVFALIEL